MRLRTTSDAWACCIGGALEQEEYLRKIKEAGFQDVQVVSSKKFHVEGKGDQ